MKQDFKQAAADLPDFASLGLNTTLLSAIGDLGYQSPSPVQAQSIPLILQGRDILAQAQTGTGKTAAFALPLLQQLDMNCKPVQLLVLTPTRELAIQVAEAFEQYGKHLQGLRIAPIYGGQKYDLQMRALKRGVQVVVGTPGRIMDHIRRGTLQIEHLKHLVLDEADEMLRMGFIDDVEWILSHTPTERQIALFSATMPAAIAKVAKTHLQQPAHVRIKPTQATAERIQQRYWLVKDTHKLDALTRILEASDFDGVIVFVRTKASTVELAEHLQARGHRSAAINGDISQAVREKTIARLKNAKIDILVATDVAARGLDVDRISHVINYDSPFDAESYVHRIGRTGRAGRTGEAILFLAKRELRLLNILERVTGHSIERMPLPSTKMINQKRLKDFKQQISDTLANTEIGEDLTFFNELIQSYHKESGQDPIQIAAALAKLLQGQTPLLLKESAINTHKTGERASEAPRKFSDKKSKKRSFAKKGQGKKKVSANTRNAPSHNSPRRKKTNTTTHRKGKKAAIFS